MRYKKLLLLLGNKKPPWYLSGKIAKANCIGAWSAKASSQANSYINLVNPGTYNLTLGSALSGWDSTNGWYFNNGTGYLVTGVTDSTAWSAICRIGTCTGGECFAAFDGTNGLILSPQYTGGTQTLYYNGNTGANPAGATASSTLGVAALNCYRGGATNGTIGGANNACTFAPYIGARNASGTPSTFFYGYVVAAAMYNTTLSAAQMAALHTAMMAL